MTTLRTTALLLLCIVSAAFCGEDPDKAVVMLGKDQPPAKDNRALDTKVPPATPESRDALEYRALSPNLIKNGNFEHGRYWPYCWEPIDRLCILWDESGGTDGKRCLRMDTNVLESQAVPWNSKVRALIDKLSEKTNGKPQSVKENPLPAPPAKRPTKPPYYDTVAGIHGVLYLSDPYKLLPGAIYRVTLDVRSERGQGNPILFVKGYFKYKGRWRNCGRLQMKLQGCSKDWRRFSVVFHPSRWSNLFGDFAARPEVLKIQLYSYWQPGNYYFDNVQMHIVGFEKYKQLRNPTPVDVKKMDEPKPEKPSRSDQDLKEGDFPVF